MNLIQTLERLDKLILAGAPLSEQRALIHSMIEQCEAHDNETSDKAAIRSENEKLRIENAELKRPKTVKSIKINVIGPHTPTYGVE